MYCQSSVLLVLASRWPKIKKILFFLKYRLYFRQKYCITKNNALINRLVFSPVVRATHYLLRNLEIKAYVLFFTSENIWPLFHGDYFSIVALHMHNNPTTQTFRPYGNVLRTRTYCDHTCSWNLWKLFIKSCTYLDE